jgi:hypothetical protein
LLESEQQEAEAWWLLSFTDDHHLGTAIVKGRGVVSAVAETHRLKVNPGGSVLAIQLPAEWDRPEWVNRLLTTAEAKMIPPPKETTR